MNIELIQLFIQASIGGHINTTSNIDIEENELGDPDFELEEPDEDFD